MKISTKKLDKNNIYLIVLSILIILHFVTHPTIHNLTDEFKYLNISKQLCQSDYSYFESEKSYHTPLLYMTLCLTSGLHNFTIPGGQLVTLSFFFLLIIGWYISLPKEFDRKKFSLLLISNSLLWVYYTRILMDVPVAFFLSLGMLHLFLFFENRKKKNYYIAVILLFLGIMTKEITLIYGIIFFLYLILKRDFDIKDYILLGIPVIPYILYLILTGPEELIWLFSVVLRTAGRNYSYIPYARVPTFAFIAGIFGPGVLSMFHMVKHYKNNSKLRNMIEFIIIMFVVWEIFFDIAMPLNLPRYHAPIIPFLTLLVSEASKGDKKFNSIYQATLVYTASTGFLASYYFHLNDGAIWKNGLIELVKKIIR